MENCYFLVSVFRISNRMRILKADCQIREKNVTIKQLGRRSRNISGKYNSAILYVFTTRRKKIAVSICKIIKFGYK